MKYKYCPLCGNELREMNSWDEGKVPYCETHDILFFDLPKPCIMVGVIRDDEILLLKQSYIYKDSMVLVSGYVAIDERAEDTVYREVLEETGIKVKDIKFLGTDYIKDKEILMLTFMATYKEGILSKSHEVEMAAFKKISEALELMNKDEVGKRVVGKIIKELRNS